MIHQVMVHPEALLFMQFFPRHLIGFYIPTLDYTKEHDIIHELCLQGTLFSLAFTCVGIPYKQRSHVYLHNVDK